MARFSTELYSELQGLELFLRGFALCLLTSLALRLLHRTTAVHRHLVCVLALVMLLILPWMPQFLPPLRLLPLQTVAASGQSALFSQDEGRIAFLNRKLTRPLSQARPHERRRGTEPSAHLPAESGTPVPGLTVFKPDPHPKSTRKAVVLFALWGLGAATLLIRLLVALLRLRRLEAGSRSALLADVPIRISDQVQTPLTWGIRRSVILLPAPLLAGDQAVCTSALRHEQAHIARWDWIWNLLAECICALCWFHPGVWWLRARMRLESERACDDRVLLSGIAGADYAAHLLQILRLVGSHEVAPAMAQSRRGMEERMRHVLDDGTPRHVPAKWLVVTAPFAFALLSLAALRVSARPAETKVQANIEIKKGIKKEIKSEVKAEVKEGVKAESKAERPQGNAGTAATLNNVDPPVPLASVVWSKAVDGLEPGFLLTTPDILKNRRVPLNASVGYKVLVRNATNQERLFVLQCSKYGPDSAHPYLIPSDSLWDALRSPGLPGQFRSAGLSDEAEVSPAYDVTLAPGEAVVVPEEWSLYIGDADKQSYPRMETIQKGMNWIVQPITVYPLSAAEQVEAAALLKSPTANKTVFTTVDRDGKTSPRSFPLVGAGMGGKQLLARIQIEAGMNRDWTLTAHAKSVSAVAFSPDSKRLVTAGADGTMNVWNVATGRRTVTLKGSTAAISSILYTADGKFILTGCSDGAIHIWDAATGAKVRTLPGRGGAVCALDASSDGKKILGGYENGTVMVWNASTGQSLATFAGDSRLLCGAISPNGKYLAAGYANAAVKGWDLQTQQPLFSKKIPSSEGVITGAHFDINDTLYTWDREEAKKEDKAKMKDGSSKLTVMTAWDIKGAILGIIQCPLPHNTISNVIAYDSFTMLFGLSEGQALLNDPHAGPVTLYAHEGPVTAVAISPDGTLVATGGMRNGRGEAKIWDILAHKPVKQAQVQ